MFCETHWPSSPIYNFSIQVLRLIQALLRDAEITKKPAATRLFPNLACEDSHCLPQNLVREISANNRHALLWNSARRYLRCRCHNNMLAAPLEAIVTRVV